MAGIELLARESIAAITIEKLAASLGVTRGSFYHHYVDRQDFFTKMLDYWEARWTLSIREEIRSLGLDPPNSILALMRTIHRRKAAGFDMAFRSWAMQDSRARKIVRKVDKERLAYIRHLFDAMGFDEMESENRSRLLLCYEMSEPAIFGKQRVDFEDQLLVERHRFLTSHAPVKHE